MILPLEQHPLLLHEIHLSFPETQILSLKKYICVILF